MWYITGDSWYTEATLRDLAEYTGNTTLQCTCTNKETRVLLAGNISLIICKEKVQCGVILQSEIIFSTSITHNL